MSFIQDLDVFSGEGFRDRWGSRVLRGCDGIEFRAGRKACSRTREASAIGGGDEDNSQEEENFHNEVFVGHLCRLRGLDDGFS